MYAKRGPGGVGVPEGHKQQETPPPPPPRAVASDPAAPPTKVRSEVVPPWGPGWPLCVLRLRALPSSSSGRAPSRGGQPSAGQMAGPP